LHPPRSIAFKWIVRITTDWRHPHPFTHPLVLDRSISSASVDPFASAVAYAPDQLTTLQSNAVAHCERSAKPQLSQSQRLRRSLGASWQQD
jgi:hypothetical protein